MNPGTVVFTIFLGLLAALPALSIDISAPTLTLLPAVLDTSRVIAGLTLSMFMAGFAFGQFSGGNLSDRHGRRPILLAGIVVYSLAGAACALSVSGPQIVASRFVQGVGAGICAVLSFVTVQDLFEGAAARSKRAYVTVVVGAVPMVAPAIGSVIVEFASWRAVHVVLAVGGLVLLGVVWLWLGETRSAASGANSRSLAGQGRLWNDRRFVELALVNALSYGAAFSYIAGSPVIVMQYYHGSSRVYAAIFACTAASLTFGAWVGGRLSRRGVSAETLLSVTLAISAAASVALAAVSFAGPAVSGPAALLLLVTILFCRGIISPNLQHLAVERQRQRAGAASAAVGVSQLLGGALASIAVAGLLDWPGLFAVSGPMLVTSLAAVALWGWSTRAGSS